RLENVVSDARVREQVRRVGLGEYVGAAERIGEALRLGPSVNPVGYALVLGAADWRRTGMTRPVPASLLPVLAQPHCRPRGFGALSDPAKYATALAWATREINPTVSLLQPSNADTFAVFDYALDLISGQAAPIGDTSWQVVIEAATPSELISIG